MELKPGRQLTAEHPENVETRNDKPYFLRALWGLGGKKRSLEKPRKTLRG
jgi:hypothetical protein